jgi:hypothetical protein
VPVIWFLFLPALPVLLYQVFRGGDLTARLFTTHYDMIYGYVPLCRVRTMYVSCYRCLFQLHRLACLSIVRPCCRDNRPHAPHAFRVPCSGGVLGSIARTSS